ncbi:UDP-3-O-(3-hydroxymyristoyl)glucosamine N-acyltransferase [Planctomicrobium sp. SH661]|uniref:UDP-3-O-(3-hydroxymyristoyl)glucosamine N-acyltransferase n=1 Tax=Planctomicrobium sp. SH661 TaxID=3448124 RepID=UPI003F5B716C
MSFSVQDLAACVDGIVQGPRDVRLSDVAPLPSAGREHLTYAESRKQLAQVQRSEAGAILVNSDLASALSDCPTPLIVVRDPQWAFIAAMLLFRPQRSRSNIGISNQALVHPSAKFGTDCNVFPGAIIGAGVVMGDRCQIGPGAIIGEGCRIGDDCVIDAHTVLYPDIILKNRVIIQANSVIGADGFGYRFVKGAFDKIPHTGTVILEDDVEVGACATIDRGMIEATIVGQGTKIDNQVMIAHNCRVGKHNVFASQVGLAGSVITGDYVQMGGQVGIADHCYIGTQVKLGGKAGVMGDIPDAGTYHDIPAIPEKDALKNHLNIRKIPELRKQVQQLTAQIAELQSQLAALTEPVRGRSAA